MAAAIKGIADLTALAHAAGMQVCLLPPAPPFTAFQRSLLP